MNKKINKVFNTITISILLICSIGICGTYLSDYLNDIGWFGDSFVYESRYGQKPMKYLEYGARHHWYNWACVLLVFTSICRTIVIVNNIISNKNED